MWDNISYIIIFISNSKKGKAKMLSIKNLTKTYFLESGDKVNALKDVSLDFPSAGLIFLLGKSGSGKTTLLNLIGGMDSPSQGEVVIDGRSSNTFTERDYDSYRNTCIGFVFQEYSLIDSLTAGANIALAAELQGKNADRAKIDDIMRQVDLTDENGKTLFDRKVNELSGGQKQRVAIARALIKDPQIILADEPTGALDSETGEKLYDLLKKLSNNKLVIVVSHDGEYATKYGDRIIKLKDGKIISDSATNSQITVDSADGGEKSSFIKSRLPVSRTIAMGLSGLKHKKFRLVLSIILAVVAFVFFGFSVTAGTADKYEAEIRTLYDKGQRMIFLVAENEKTTTQNGQTITSRIPFTDVQIDAITEYNGGTAPMKGTAIPSGINEYVGENGENLLWSSNPYVRFAVSGGSAAELDPVTGAEDARLSPDARFRDKNRCRLPQTKSEVALTDIKADMFMRYGYKEADGTLSAIAAPDDLIGRKLGELEICGVYSTEQDKSIFETYDIDDYPVHEDSYVLHLMHGTGGMRGPIENDYVCKGYSDIEGSQRNPGVFFLKLSGDLNKDLKLLEQLSYTEGNTTCSFSFYSAYSGFGASVRNIIDYAAFPAVVGIIFAVFSALLLINFLMVSLDFKKRELGILRALGARRKDITLICLIESGAIAFIDFVLSLIGTIIACLSFNAYYYLSVFNVGFLTVASLFLLCFGVAAIATILPVKRMTSKKPVDIINNK